MDDVHLTWADLSDDQRELLWEGRTVPACYRAPIRRAVLRLLNGVAEAKAMALFREEIAEVYVKQNPPEPVEPDTDT